MAAMALAASPFVAPCASAKALLGEPEVDRASDQYDGMWCPAEQTLSFDGTFTADGPEVTLKFIATNHEMGNWRHERIDNVTVLRLADYLAYKHLPDSALAADYSCLEPTKSYFHFSDVPPADLIFIDQFHNGPDPAWDMSDGAYENQGSALNAFELPIDTTGESLGLGLDEVPTTEATSEITLTGFTAGQQYVVSTWTNVSDATIGNDLVIQIYGTEFFSIAGQQPIDTGPGRGLAWGDYDNDGDLDVFVSNFNAPSRLWRNNGAGVFTDVTLPSGTWTVDLTTAVSWGDVDGDGDLDLYLASHGLNRYFRNLGSGVFVDATVGALGDLRKSDCIDWGDYDRDGDLDLFIGNVETDALVRNDGATFVDVASGDLLGSGRPVGCSWVDFDDDGDLDLFVTYNLQPNELFVNTGGAFVKSTPASLASPMNNATAAWGDYDNDGDLDVYFTSQGSGNRLCRNLGGGNFAVATPPILADTGTGVESIWGDWENDGDLDLYLIKRFQPNRLFKNLGAGAFGVQTTGTVEYTGDAQGTAWGDTDGDGDIDMHLVYVGDDLLLRNEIGDNSNWLHVDLKGDESNAFGVGAKVFVTTREGTQMREVGGESGFRSQNSLTAEFGLGTDDVVDQVVVEWPSGVVQALNGVPANQKIVISESSSTGVGEIATSGTGATEPQLFANAPNPFRESTSIGYSLPWESEVELRVYDVLGRVVTTLESGARGAGSHTVEWNARDEDGGPVVPGIYFYELSAGGATETRKMIRLE